MKRIITIITLMTGLAQALQPQAKDIAKLEPYVRNADVVEFKTAYDAIDNNQKLKNRLLGLAQSAKKVSIAELQALGDSTINKKKLAIGTLQAFGVVCCLAQIAYIGYGAIMPLKSRKLGSKIGSRVKVLNSPKHLRESKSALLFCPVTSIYYISHFLARLADPAYGKYVTATIAPTLCALSGYGAYKALNASAKNLNQGWSYKKHLETQIKNLDEIIAYLQNSNDRPITKG